MEIKGTCKRFFYRVIMDLISMVILIAVGLILVLIDDGPLLLFMIIVSISIFRFFYVYFREKYFVTLFLCENNIIYLEYFKFDQVIKVSFSINEFDLLNGGEFRGQTQALALIFRRNRKKILTQYQGGVWTKDKMIELYEYIRQVKLKHINKFLSGSVSMCFMRSYKLRTT